jgi:hypothetical protein
MMHHCEPSRGSVLVQANPGALVPQDLSPNSRPQV